jgi:hypothetical protein
VDDVRGPCLPGGALGIAGIGVGQDLGVLEAVDYLEVFRRGAQQRLEQQAASLSAPQPLWTLWELVNQGSSNALMMEFVALANHRKEIRDEIAVYSNRYRAVQLDAVSAALEAYGLDSDEYPAVVVVLFLVAVSRFLQMEDAIDVSSGHAGAVEVIERIIASLEGPLRLRSPARAARARRRAPRADLPGRRCWRRSSPERGSSR